jgi:hypothetical protein
LRRCSLNDDPPETLEPGTDVPGAAFDALTVNPDRPRTLRLVAATTIEDHLDHVCVGEVAFKVFVESAIVPRDNIEKLRRGDAAGALNGHAFPSSRLVLKATRSPAPEW